MMMSLCSIPSTTLQSKHILNPSLTTTQVRNAHFQFVPETPNPADGEIYEWKVQGISQMYLIF